MPALPLIARSIKEALIDLYVYMSCIYTVCIGITINILLLKCSRFIIILLSSIWAINYSAIKI